VSLATTVKIKKFNIFIRLTGKISQYQPNKLQGVIPHMTVISIQLVPEYQHYFVFPCILIPDLYSVFSDTYICYKKQEEKVHKWKSRLLISLDSDLNGMYWRCIKQYNDMLCVQYHSDVPQSAIVTIGNHNMICPFPAMMQEQLI
jgi:hypothetical protein